MENYLQRYVSPGFYTVPENFSKAFHCIDQAD